MSIPSEDGGPRRSREQRRHVNEFWFCDRCQSMNRANADQCYRCRSPRELVAKVVVTARQEGVVLTPGLDEEHRGVAWTLMSRQRYYSAWKLGYVATVLLVVTLILSTIENAALMPVALMNGFVQQVDIPRQLILGIAICSAALSIVGLITIVVHSAFLALTSMAVPALGSGTPRFHPARAAVWWIEGELWAIRGSLAFIVPPLLSLLAMALFGLLGILAGIVWFVCAYMFLGDPVTCLAKPRRLLLDLYQRLAIPGSEDTRKITLWSLAWGVFHGLGSAVAGLVYLVFILFVFVAFIAELAGSPLTLISGQRLYAVEIVLSLTVLTIETIASIAALYFLAQITLDLANRQRFRERWVLEGAQADAAPEMATAFPDRATRERARDRLMQTSMANQVPGGPGQASAVAPVAAFDLGPDWAPPPAFQPSGSAPYPAPYPPNYPAPYPPSTAHSPAGTPGYRPPSAGDPSAGAPSPLQLGSEPEKPVIQPSQSTWGRFRANLNEQPQAPSGSSDSPGASPPAPRPQPKPTDDWTI